MSRTVDKCSMCYYMFICTSHQKGTAWIIDRSVYHSVFFFFSGITWITLGHKIPAIEFITFILSEIIWIIWQYFSYCPYPLWKPWPHTVCTLMGHTKAKGLENVRPECVKSSVLSCCLMNRRSQFDTNRGIFMAYWLELQVCNQRVADLIPLNKTPKPSTAISRQPTEKSKNIIDKVYHCLSNHRIVLVELCFL